MGSHGDWETCCQALFQRPAVWVQQVVEGVRVLHAQGHQGEIPQPLAQHGEIGNGRAAESRGSDATSTKQDRGQSYLLRRLARDAPEILERVKAGEFRSARAAAIEAGIIRPVATVRLVDDMAAVASKLQQHLTTEQLEQLKALL